MKWCLQNLFPGVIWLVLALSYVSKNVFCHQFFFEHTLCLPALLGLVCSSSSLRLRSNCGLNAGDHADICLKVYLPLQWTPTTAGSLFASVCIHHISLRLFVWQRGSDLSSTWQLNAAAKENKKVPAMLISRTHKGIKMICGAAASLPSVRKLSSATETF